LSDELGSPSANACHQQLESEIAARDDHSWDSLRLSANASHQLFGKRNTIHALKAVVDQYCIDEQVGHCLESLQRLRLLVNNLHVVLTVEQQPAATSNSRIAVD
jgi:hypothetical protein